MTSAFPARARVFTAPGHCGMGAVVRPLVYFLPLALLSTGCLSPQKQLAKMERQTIQENSRVTEQRRMGMLSSGEVQSSRWAEAVVWDPNKKFDPNASGVGAARTFGTGGARTKEFRFDQKVESKSFAARDYAGAKDATTVNREFSTSAANTSGKYAIPNADREAGSKTAMTRELPDGTKVAATNELRDGSREYLGRERAKLGNSMDPKDLANWRNGAGETVIYNGTGVDRLGTIKQLTIEDVRELLNKNK